jgi:hypothetical protein
MNDGAIDQELTANLQERMPLVGAFPELWGRNTSRHKS